MTQSSTSRNTRTSGLRRPALALAFGTAAVASALAPVASMADTASYNDTLPTGIAKTQGVLPVPAKFGGATVALQTKRTTPLPATAIPLPTTSLGTTIRGDVYSQSIGLSAGVKRTTLNNAYAAWKTAATPVINAWIAYTKAAPAKKAAALSVYNIKLAVYNKKAVGTYNNGLTKWTAYSNAYNAWSTVYKAQLATVQSNHFKLAAHTDWAATCSKTNNLKASQMPTGNGIVDAPGAIAGVPSDVTGAGYAVWCNPQTGDVNYYLPERGGQLGAGWESITATISTDPAAGKVTSAAFTTDAALTSDSYITYINGGIFFNGSAVSAWLQNDANKLTATKRSDINGYATKAIVNGGGYLTTGQTCISAAAGATLTCQAFTESLQNALNAAYVVSPK